MRLIDCQGLAGAMTYGAVAEGFELETVKALPGGFGKRSVEANRHLLGPIDWWYDEGPTWAPQAGSVEFVVGCPPCAGFSGLNSSKGSHARGSSAAINDCMKSWADFVGLQRPAVAAMESVQGAYKQGHDLMLELRERAEAHGARYDLIHLLVYNKELGNAQWGRRRYFMVLAEAGMEIGWPALRQVVPTTAATVLGDLVGHDDCWAGQPYRGTPTTHAQKRARIGAGEVLTGHARAMSKMVDRVEAIWDHMPVGRKMDAREFCERTGITRKNVDNWWGPMQRKLDPDGPVPTIRYEGGSLTLHWSEKRTLTAREVARVVGLPDTWDLSGARNPAEAGMWLGKGVSVHAARYLARGVHESLEGRPGPWQGEEIGPRERLVDAR